MFLGNSPYFQLFDTQSILQYIKKTLRHFLKSFFFVSPDVCAQAHSRQRCRSLAKITAIYSLYTVCKSEL